MINRLRHYAVLTAWVCLFLLPLAGSLPAHAAAVTITITNFAFEPSNATIATGDTVTFVNGDDTIHSVVGDNGSFHSAALDTNDKFSQTFIAKGEIGYHCGLHPFMRGKIVVK